MTGTDLGRTASGVVEGLRLMIERGQVRMGGRLPSERRLSEVFGVSRETVRRALARLEEAGEVRRARGRAGGAFALRPNPNWPAYSWSRLSGERDRVVERPVGVSVPAFLRHQRFEVSTRVVATRTGPGEADVRTALGLAPGDDVTAVERVRMADGFPLSWERLYVAARRFPGLLGHDLTGSLSQVFAEEYGAVAHEVRERVRLRLAEPHHHTHLDVSAGQPLLAITRTAYDQDGAPLEFSYDLFRADRTELRISSVNRPGDAGPAPQEPA
ncbi:GntR family transcriptional regulator [Streptomyces roseirectus]|uniref:GntR family transcriptional regulator n=1 Tax=Streptomyces roseirectus TaxID=2768066 RepID=A0A7H0IQL5_9ACTN|nr:GntR family transcriptional regulator [Streptomyces roseirectus]QNP75081.1 GntR family transcriptional regulator [Streptomyces roseirectus]